MTRPLIIDAFCKAGGAGMGYHRAGFDVLGIDIEPQPHYPFTFVQADALEFLASANLSSVAAIHASPPCQDHMRGFNTTWEKHGTGWMLAATREKLMASGKPWVIENVPGAPMRVDLKLCGCMFGLPRLKRERWFETSPQLFDMRPPCHHPNGSISVAGTSPGHRGEKELLGHWPRLADWRAAMGIDWMGVKELSQAIPPAYTEYVGRQLLATISAG